MKRLFLLLIATVMVCGASMAQTVKFGRVNSGQIIEALPETKDIKTKIEARKKELTDQITQMQEELSRKMAAFEKDAPTLTGLIADQRRRDIVELQGKLENFAREAENDLAQFQAQITAPVFKKVQDAIDKVSKLQGLAFVIDESGQGGPFVYFDKTKFKDITALVKSELKIK